MKKLLILLLALSLILCFAACAGNDEPIETTPAETSSAAVESSEESSEAEETTKAEKPEKEQASTGDGWTANY